jgi:hypothetical protein
MKLPVYPQDILFENARLRFSNFNPNALNE